jgi:AcrR family transcriptional regulator
MVANTAVANTAAQGSPAVKPSARERLLAAANDLFYSEGVQSVGIDRVIEQAGVAKASLYNTFGSKEELIRAYLESRRAGITARITTAIERYDTPRDRLLGVFQAQAELFDDPNFQGCAFAKASAEARPGSAADVATRGYRTWLRTLFAELAEQAGATDPASLAQQLHLVYDGVGLSARMDRDPGASIAARAAARILLDAATA